MQTESLGLKVGTVKVMTTDHGGFPVEHWADRFLVRLINVSDTADPVIKESVEEFKDSIRIAAIHYMKNAIKSEHTNIYNVLFEAGHNEAAELVRHIKET
jgi:hypothetical protein